MSRCFFIHFKNKINDVRSHNFTYRYMYACYIKKYLFFCIFYDTFYCDFSRYHSKLFSFWSHWYILLNSRLKKPQTQLPSTLFFEFDHSGHLYTRVYDKRDDSGSNLPISSSFRVNTSELIEYSRPCCCYSYILIRHRRLSKTLMSHVDVNERLVFSLKKFI